MTIPTSTIGNLPSSPGLTGSEVFAADNGTATQGVTTTQIATYLGPQIATQVASLPQTLTNKTIDGNNNTLLDVPASQLVGSINVTLISGQWPVANGGTGAASLTGVLLGNGTAAISSATGSDIASLFTGGAASSAYYLAADGTKQLASGGGGSLANPTALVGLTAVNGVAATGIRSDGAPALDVSIAPTWTGAHTWSTTATFNSILNAARINVTGTSTATNGFALPTGNTPTAYSNGAARYQWTSSGITLLTGGNFIAGTIGMGLQIKEGTNAKMGVATLSAGTVVVSNTAVTANSRIFLTAQSLGTVSSPSALCISARTAGTSFTILASQNTDTSVIAWQIVEPAP